MLLTIIFLATQTGALAHAYANEHDSGSTQAQVCSICLAGQSLGSAHIASALNIEFRHHNGGVSIIAMPAPDGIHPPLARQRAPPAPLQGNTDAFGQ
ncbi:MAG: hypothetical protein OEQ74_00245 [Gammaproteobacteria bacterium]|nr:hypothetical protein [Gammaproteobacteria bacterium]